MKERKLHPRRQLGKQHWIEVGRDLLELEAEHGDVITEEHKEEIIRHMSEELPNQLDLLVQLRQPSEQSE